MTYQRVDAVPDQKKRSHILQRDHERKVSQLADEIELQALTSLNCFCPLKIKTKAKCDKLGLNLMLI